MKVIKMGISVLAGVILIGVAFAQQATTSSQPQQDKSAQAPQAQMMSMDDRMKACDADIHTLMKSGDDLKKAIVEARASGDPAKVNAALDAAEKHFDSMNGRMNTCVSMMHEMNDAVLADGQMQHMGHGMMMNDGAKDSTQPSK